MVKSTVEKTWGRGVFKSLKVSQQMHIVGLWTIRRNSYFDSEKHQFVYGLITWHTLNTAQKVEFGSKWPHIGKIPQLFSARIDDHIDLRPVSKFHANPHSDMAFRRPCLPDRKFVFLWVIFVARDLGRHAFLGNSHIWASVNMWNYIRSGSRLPVLLAKNR